MSEFRFAEPLWVHALWGVLAFAALLWVLERRSGGALERIVGSALQSRLVRRPSSWRRQARIALLTLSAVCCVLALMRPQLGVRHVAAQRVGAEIMVALDVSNSMLAEDVAPNRLERAKAEIVDLLAYLDGDQVGLIAFAGRATVLAPMTPDFGFLRLVLAGAGPGSVARGGTRLEEPIRKAVQGFGSGGEAGRALLLITDGEDHDSFALDAAKEAAEAGIVIVAIGFGDENGSEIYITDPETGARQVVRDANGRPVRSRLDGDLLRDLALATGGAYVPAGTGVLDLESIFRQHIEGLMSGQLDPRGRTVRDEAYQWAVLLAIVFLVSAVAVSSGGAAITLALAMTLSGVVGNDVASAANAQSTAVPPAASEGPALPVEPSGAESSEPAEPEPETPREIYNLGVAALDAGDFDEALHRFEQARREGVGDAELRFRSAYDLGVANAARADSLEADAPKDALQALYTAADWFRDAIAQRPDDEDARANLEVALKRALLLADRLAARNAEGVDEALKQLAGRQRELAADIAGLLQLVAEDPDLFAVDRLRREFRARATAQRALLADGDRLARQADTERENLATKDDAERTPEDQMREAQLGGVLHYLHRARERMGQARRQLRQRQGQRAYRRGSAALTELKRAIDQLSDPVAVLDLLIRDATELASGTAALGASRRELPGATDASTPAPVWLSDEVLAEDQQSLADRVDELDQRLLAGLASEAPPEPDAQALLASLREAEPLVAQARSHFEAAVEALEAASPDAALPRQAEGVVALSDARERFLDLKGLIEAAYADEKRIAGVLGAEDEPALAAREEFLPTLREYQARNIERAQRLDAKLQAAAAAPPPAAGAGAGEGDAEAHAIEQQRYDLAGQLLTMTLARMDDVTRSLGPSGGGAHSWSDAKAAGDQAVDHLEAMRRLFFSIVEELRDVARVQVDLGDATQDALAQAAAQPDAPAALAARLGPLPIRQRALAERAGHIATALEEQSNESGGVLEQETDAYETSRRLREAGEHVLLAQTEMEGAATGLDGEPPEFEASQQSQIGALSELEQALALLVPPEERQPQNQGDEQQQQQQQEQQQGQGEQGDEEQQAARDPAQLLQEVRDREAQRRRDREQRQRAGYETVEKDW